MRHRAPQWERKKARVGERGRPGRKVVAGVKARVGQGSVTEGLEDAEFGSYSERSENYWILQSWGQQW